MRVALLGGVVLCLGCSGSSRPSERVPAAAEASSAPDVQKILTAMRARYRSANSYRDEGTYRVVLHSKDSPDLIMTGRFRTAWVSPARLGFELREDADELDSGETFAVWTPRGGGVKSLFLDEVHVEDSLDEALGALQGVSHGVSGLVPRLLRGDCECRTRYELQSTVACGNATCFALVGTSDGDRITLFIDTKTSALRRYEERGTVTPTDVRSLRPELLGGLTPAQREALEKRRREPFEAESTIEIDPTFDVAIEEKELEGALTLPVRSNAPPR